MAKQITEETKTRVLKMLKAGSPLATIARDCGISLSSINNIRRVANAVGAKHVDCQDEPPRPPPEDMPKTGLDLAMKVRDDLIAHAVNMQLSLDELQQRLDETLRNGDASSTRAKDYVISIATVQDKIVKALADVQKIEKLNNIKPVPKPDFTRRVKPDLKVVGQDDKAKKAKNV